MRLTEAARPQAIAMWDFSWLERRWPGAGYEDWDLALAGLRERGYDLVRIDAYPHLVSAGGERVWSLPPRWTQQSWGAQSPIDVQVLPGLVQFVAAAARHGIGVALSTWFRTDRDEVRMLLRTPAELAKAWTDTLDVVAAAGLLEHVTYVDLCNEFPLAAWAPFLYGTDVGPGLPRSHPRIEAWMRESIEIVRAAYPDLDYTYSFAGRYGPTDAPDVRTFDLLEPHVWMASASDFNKDIDYNFELFDPRGYDNLVRLGRRTYEADPEHYDGPLFEQIDWLAQWSRTTGKPLVTTECWSIIDYKDWPGLDWDWVMELNERALTRASATGRWVALATSNFCGPQFVGMWREVDYHRRLTGLIHDGPLDVELGDGDRVGT
ncbi:cellulase-like family protein [Rugosimonospora africana]|uniref:Cellulase n=1 Tax=Rugosimonospora africana TaxID=556532 RepID=A0A8J3QUC8_9ACTN|nr:cellulase-like family protein [Rugosimonospora africana]GIH17239.1 hypothetical protein Raf01_54110 [Rugosimonospora africana]